MASILKRGKHYKMERFAATFVTLVLALAIIVGIGEKTKYDNSKITLTTQALYTTDAVQWSLSGQQIQVQNIYRNSDSTKAFVLFYMDDMSDMSTEADDYKVFITGSNNTEITHQMTGAFYIFGSTGYMGLSLMDSLGFEPAISNVVIRNTSMVTAAAKSEDEDTGYTDESFNIFNQMQFYANFSGTDAVEVNFLDDTDATVYDIYAETVLPEKEQEIRQTLNTDLVKYNDGLSLLNEYRRRLESYGFTNIPSIPDCIANDYVTTNAADTDDNPTEFDESMLDLNSSVIKSNYNEDLAISSNDDISRYVDSDTIYIATDFVFPGGYQYNYQDVSLTDHYLTQIVPDGETYESWRAAKQAEANENSGYSWYTSTTSGWLRNGTVYTYNPETTLESEKSYNQAINDYNNEINTLISLKQQYQCTDLYELFDLESTAEALTTVVDINATSGLVTMY